MILIISNPTCNDRHTGGVDKRSRQTRTKQLKECYLISKLIVYVCVCVCVCVWVGGWGGVCVGGGVCVWVWVWVGVGVGGCGCVCVGVCVCVCLFTSIQREDFICLGQLECQGTGQRYCVEDISFLCQVPSSLL